MLKFSEVKFVFIATGVDSNSTKSLYLELFNSISNLFLAKRVYFFWLLIVSTVVSKSEFKVYAIGTFMDIL